MAKSPDNRLSGHGPAELGDWLGEFGLHAFGAFEIAVSDCPTGEEPVAPATGMLIGNAGGAMWAAFRESAEYSDRMADPLDRWSERVLGGLARQLDCRVIFPSSRPYWPFQVFARKATGARSSPLGILMHPQYGLWHGFRGALLFPADHELHEEFSRQAQVRKNVAHPCDSCSDRPCLSACPVGAFSNNGLDVSRCFSHLGGGQEPDCMGLGCQARAVCPFAIEHQYESMQTRFHMRAYFKP